MPDRPKKYSANPKYKMKSVKTIRVEEDPMIPQIDDVESAEQQMKKISCQTQNQKKSLGYSIDKNQGIEDISSIHPSMNQSNF
jgi:hypothetical protein